jgi:hypothetical protein
MFQLGPPLVSTFHPPIDLSRIFSFVIMDLEFVANTLELHSSESLSGCHSLQGA